MPGFVPVTYSGGAPVFRSDGLTQRVACAHLAEWLVERDALEVARGRGHIAYYQTQGDAPESFLTHIDGSAGDRKHTSIASVMDSRQMGMAEYPRIAAFGWTGAQHDHGMIPCGHNAHNLYQWDAYLAGYDGLGASGRLHLDPLPRPATIRTWQQGIVWAHAEIARLNGTTTTIQEDEMKLLRANTGVYYLVTAVNIQEIQPAYVGAATLLAGAPVDCLAADITRLQDIIRANRPPAVDIAALAKAVAAAIPGKA
jgi:hypothetical protein